MSLANVLPLFRTRLDGLGYSEWDDAFNVENIPSTILDKSYHLDIGLVTGGGIPHRAQNAEMPVTARIFLKGYRDMKTSKDNAVSESQTILCDILATSVRLDTNVKNIILVTSYL